MKKEESSKNGFEHFMLKEIFEQPKTIEQAMHRRIQEELGTAIFEEINLDLTYFQSIRRILILGCGASLHAGYIGASLLESMAHITTQVEMASEFRYTNPIISKDTLVLAISQSGETADTIAAIQRTKKAKVISICNEKNSTIPRISDNCIFLHAGPEVSVCATKSFTSNLIVLSLFTLFIARIRGLTKEEGQHFLQELQGLTKKICQTLAQADQIQQLAKKYSSFEHFLFIGCRYMFATSLEAALKLKEVSYLNANGCSAGELRHGPLAFVSSKTAVIGMCGNMETKAKVLSSLTEVHSLGGHILAFAPENTLEFKKLATDVLYLPEINDCLAAIPYSIAGQLFAYYIAKQKQTQIDQPRSLVKSIKQD